MSEPLSADERRGIAEAIEEAGNLALLNRFLATLVAARPPDPDALREAAHRLHEAAWRPNAGDEDRDDLDRLADGSHAPDEDRCRACRGFMALAAPAAPPPDPHVGCLFNHEHRYPECYDEVAPPPDLAALLHPWTCREPDPRFPGNRHPDTDGGWLCNRAAADVAFRLGTPTRKRRIANDPPWPDHADMSVDER